MSIQPLVFASGGSEVSWGLAEAGSPVDLERLVPGARSGPSAALRAGEADPGGESPAEPPWELEIGFGKGRYLIRRAREEPEGRFLGIEMAGQYFRILVERARKRGLANLVAVRGEALYLLSAVLPRRFARAVHVYHPDPWPKARHQKRRLFDPETVDLVLGALAPGGTLYFATDHLDYGALVREILESHPGVTVHDHPGPWPDGARTNYEAKYVAEGREILRLTAVAKAEPPVLHPAGVAGVVSAFRPPEDE
ncbi:MAG: tRNA (guanine(46)-N(7))-methyltransferase TrmB [Thermoanaerobaculia bacterium]